MKKATFSDVLDTAGNLQMEEREELIELLKKRTVEERRLELSKEVKNARLDYKKGKFTAASVDSIMKEILS